MNGSNGMILKEMVNQVGKNSQGYEYTPLMIAAERKHLLMERMHCIVQQYITKRIRI